MCRNLRSSVASELVIQPTMCYLVLWQNNYIFLSRVRFLSRLSYLSIDGPSISFCRLTKQAECGNLLNVSYLVYSLAKARETRSTANLAHLLSYLYADSVTGCHHKLRTLLLLQSTAATTLYMRQRWSNLFMIIFVLYTWYFEVYYLYPSISLYSTLIHSFTLLLLEL